MQTGLHDSEKGRTTACTLVCTTKSHSVARVPTLADGNDGTKGGGKKPGNKSEKGDAELTLRPLSLVEASLNAFFMFRKNSASSNSGPISIFPMTKRFRQRLI